MADQVRYGIVRKRDPKLFFEGEYELHMLEGIPLRDVFRGGIGVDALCWYRQNLRHNLVNFFGHSRLPSSTDMNAS